jgi:competence protein ComEC
MRKTLLVLLMFAATGAGAWFGHMRFRLPEFPGPTLHIAFIDVAHGDSILVQTPEGRAALIDAGDEEDGKTVTEFLRLHGVDRLDMLIMTHPHSDHIGGVPEALRTIPVDHVLDCGCSFGTESGRRALDQIRGQKIPYGLARRGQIFHLGNPTTIQILMPQRTLTEKAATADNDCIVARVSFGGVSTLLLSDIGSDEEARLIAENPDLTCDVIKVSGHGGSRTTSNELLKLTKPAYAVITVGSRRDHARPDRETLRRLQAAGARIKRTDECGAVILTTDGRRIRLTGER